MIPGILMFLIVLCWYFFTERGRIYLYIWLAIMLSLAIYDGIYREGLFWPPLVKVDQDPAVWTDCRYIEW